jgi:ParB-like chromosome segregation protein Spo0J
MMKQNIGRLARSRSLQDRLKRNSNLNIQYRRIDTLQPDPTNPRRHSKKQLKQIANSIKVFDFIVPILIDRDGKIVCGHGRTQAAAALGMREVPTICLEHLSPAQIRAFMIADNKLTENATWDDRLLAEQLRDLSLLGLDFSLEITGFEMGEIDLRIASLEESLAPSDDPADILPEPSVGSSVSQLGDLWFLRRHLGDERDQEHDQGLQCRIGLGRLHWPGNAGRDGHPQQPALESCGGADRTEQTKHPASVSG